MSYNKKVKMFSAGMKETLEQDINDWISCNSDICEIISISFTGAQWFYALIYYTSKG